uniref:Uncharacterized protein n=1 Tax=Rhipicephalus appendiculatus TaxID=34631 RepID=A0A131YBX7_RHIAP
MSDGMCCYILGIYVASGTIYMYCQQLLTTSSAFDVPHILRCHQPPPSENHALYCIEDVSSQCVFLNVCNISYLCELPNKLEKN